MGNAAIAGIEHENAVSERTQQTPVNPAQAPIEINVGAPQLQVPDLNMPLGPVGPVLYTAQSGDSISTVLGTSAPGPVGAFMAANGLTGSTLYAGRQYVIPSGDYTPGNEARGQAALIVDNQRIAAQAERTYSAINAWMSADVQQNGFDLFPSATYGPARTPDITDAMSPLQMQVMDTNPDSPQYASLQQQLYAQQAMRAANNNDYGTAALLDLDASLVQTQQAMRNGIVTDGFMSAAPDPNVQLEFQNNLAAAAGGIFVAGAIGAARYFGASEQAVQNTGELAFNTELGFEGARAPEIDTEFVAEGAPQYAFNSVENPGPLAVLPGRPAANFYGGQYNMSVSNTDIVLYRAGSSAPGNELGQWFTKEPPQSVAQVRIDSAVQPQWIDPETGVLTGESLIDTTYGIKFPAGTILYEGPVGYQGGVHLGGPDKNQIFVYQPWNIPGVQVVSKDPLK